MGNGGNDLNRGLGLVLKCRLTRGAMYRFGSCNQRASSGTWHTAAAVIRRRTRCSLAESRGTITRARCCAHGNPPPPGRRRDTTASCMVSLSCRAVAPVIGTHDGTPACDPAWCSRGSPRHRLSRAVRYRTVARRWRRRAQPVPRYTARRARPVPTRRKPRRPPNVPPAPRRGEQMPVPAASHLPRPLLSGRALLVPRLRGQCLLPRSSTPHAARAR